MVCSHPEDVPAAHPRGINLIATSNFTGIHYTHIGRTTVNGLTPLTPRGGTGPPTDRPSQDGSQRIGGGPYTLASSGESNPTNPAQEASDSLNDRPPNGDREQNNPLPRTDNNTPAKDYIKAATLNMRGRTSMVGGYRREKWFEIYGILNASRIAILAIQEAHLTDELANNVNRAFETKMALFHSPLPDTRNAAGVAIVINKSILNADRVTCEEIIPGRAILATINWHANTKIKILNIYAPNDTRANVNFWEKLNEITMSNPNLKPDLMLGDFNLVEDSLDRLPCHQDDANAVAALGELKSNLHLIDGWRNTHPDKREYTHQHAPNASQGRIDRIYITQELLRPAKEWKIDPPPIETDHWIASAKISTTDAPLIGKGRWQIPTYLFENDEIMKEINEKGKKALNDIETIRHRRTDTNNPQTIFANLKTEIREMCRTHAKKIHPTITNKIEKLKKRLNTVNNDPLIPEDDKMLESIVVKTEILELERILYESNRVYAKTKHHVHAETICRDWIRTNRAKKPRDTIFSLYNPLNPEIPPTHDSQEMAKIAKEYHENLQSRDRNPTDAPDQTRINAILENINTSTTPKQKNELAQHLNWGKVHQALHESANDKAAGLDGIPMELWKKMSSNFDAFSDAEINPFCDIIKILVKVFNDIETQGITPSTKFNEGWMCPLYKKGERDNIANYRPITVLNTDYKIMTKALANKLAEAAPTLIHRDQAGFIKGRNIYDQVKLAKLMIDYGKIRKQNGAIVALDQEKAYDKILHPYLWKTLEKFDIPQHFIKTVKHLYQDASTSILINGILSDPYIVNRGVRQGDGLSCLLFDLGIEPLAAAIRNSPIKGIQVEDAPENIKCKLFADDTMVYLDESDNIETLENHALKPWCKVSGAVFNIAKTEIIPIGSNEYRDSLISTRKMNPESEPIQANIKIATEGQPVRVLGAWIGNNVDQATPWTPTIEKIAASLKRWEANHPTTEGRRLITQMIIGGMSQYLAKVQGIPETALKTLEKIIRNFSWNGESKPTVSIAHMTNNTENGGKKVLDIFARNEAIQLTWAQAYLKMGDDRPTWALIADEILRNDVPGEIRSLTNNRNARINQFMQTWHSRMKQRKNTDDNEPNIPNDLKEMLKVAKKYGIRLEANHPTPQVRAELPAIRNIQTKEQEKPDTLCDKYGKCIRDKHKIRTLNDVKTLSKDTPNNHKRNKKCKCDKCTKIRNDTNGTCKHPNKCIERATKLLESINEKWDPTKLHPPDFKTNPEPKEVGPSYNPNTKETTHTLNPFRIEESLKDCFRVFTESTNPSPNTTKRASKTNAFNDPPAVVYTDGSCTNNGETNARAGSGIWYGENDERNTSLRVPGPEQSNQTGELYAILHALRTIPPDQALIIKTDSMYAIQGLTKNLEKWEDQGWMYSKHATLFKSITAWVRHRSNTTKLIWVKGHSGIRGNEEADKLANNGTQKEPPQNETEPNAPENTIPSGAKLSALSQRDFYRGILATNRPPPRKSTEINLGRIQACAEEYYGTSPKRETIWKATRHKDLSKKTREFIWKCIHDAFKIGKFWRNIPNFENRGICAHCDTEETMEHILTECDAPGREKIWSLANELWRKRSQTPIPSNYGAVIGCCLTDFKKANGKPDKGLNRLFRIIVSESMFTIWKIRCERTITWGNDPSKTHSQHEIHNKWLQAINARLKIDSVQTNQKIFKKKAIEPKIVLKTWNNCLKDNLHETRNWCGKTGVLVGITPERPPGRNR